jgi:hypothetical protein
MVRITKPSFAAKTLGIPLTTSKNGKYRRATAGSCKDNSLDPETPRFHGYERNNTTKVTLFQEVNTILSAPAQDITVPQCNTPFPLSCLYDEVWKTEGKLARGICDDDNDNDTGSDA